MQLVKPGPHALNRLKVPYIGKFERQIETLVQFERQIKMCRREFAHTLLGSSEV